MKKIEALIKPFMVEAVKDALVELGIEGMTLTEVIGFGATTGTTMQYRGQSRPVTFVARIKLEIVVPGERLARRVIETIEESARSGRPGDGKIFVTEVLEAIRIRTGDWGEAAI